MSPYERSRVPVEHEARTHKADVPYAGMEWVAPDSSHSAMEMAMTTAMIVMPSM